MEDPRVGSNGGRGSTVEVGCGDNPVGSDKNGPGEPQLTDYNLTVGRKDAWVREDLDPVLKGGMGSEGNQMEMSAYRGKHLLRDEL